jgi:transposase-like protein
MAKKRSAGTAGHGDPTVTIPRELLEQLVPGPMTPEGLEAVFRGFKKAFLERALNAELDAHLEGDGGPGNHRNGSSGKTVLTDEGAVRLAVPRDRTGSFEPQLVPKHARRFAGFDDKIVSLYARGMSVREIQQYLQQMYAVEVSPDLVSRVTDAVLEEVTAWQGRPLEPLYPLVFFDALRVKIRADGAVHNKAVYLALGVQADGTRDVLGLWIEQTEGARFWLRVFTDLRSRGVVDILLGVADGLKGLPEALEAVFPHTTLQTCIVHLIRHSLGYVPWRERKAMAAALRPVYTAATAEAAEAALQALEDSPLGQRYPTVAPAWRRAWTQVVPFFAFAPEVRRMIYTTNAIESVHARLRKIIKTRGHFPTDEAATKLIWLALRNIKTVWNKPPIAWTAAMNQFAILYGDRIERAGR